MSNLNEQEYKNLVEVRHCYTEEQVNRLLKAGWKLLCVAPYKEPGESYLIYSLGRFKTYDEIQNELLQAIEKDNNN